MIRALRELMARAMAKGGGGVFQAIPAGATGDSAGTPEQQSLLDEVAMLARLSRETQQPGVFSTVQVPGAASLWRQVLALAGEENGRGARLAPMVAPRPVTFLTSLATYHVFIQRPTFLRLAGLDHDALVAELRKPQVKAAILSERDERHPSEGAWENTLPGMFRTAVGATFPMHPGFNYEPHPDKSIRALAAAEGRDPIEYMYDYLLMDNGRAVAVFLSSNYGGGNLNACHDMLLDPHTVIGLSDAGAHVPFVSDMSSPTFNMTHWVRDRSRGPRLPIELMVAKATAVPAGLFGMKDRGTLEVAQEIIGRHPGPTDS